MGGSTTIRSHTSARKVEQASVEGAMGAERAGCHDRLAHWQGKRCNCIAGVHSVHFPSLVSTFCVLAAWVTLDSTQNCIFVRKGEKSPKITAANFCITIPPSLFSSWYNHLTQPSLVPDPQDTPFFSPSPFQHKSYIYIPYPSPPIPFFDANPIPWKPSHIRPQQDLSHTPTPLSWIFSWLGRNSDVDNIAEYGRRIVP